MNSRNKLINQIEEAQKSLLHEEYNLSIHKKYFSQLINKNQMLLKFGFPLGLWGAWKFNILKILSRWGMTLWEWGLVFSNAKKFLIKN